MIIPLDLTGPILHVSGSDPREHRDQTRGTDSIPRDYVAGISLGHVFQRTVTPPTFALDIRTLFRQVSEVSHAGQSHRRFIEQDAAADRLQLFQFQPTTFPTRRRLGSAFYLHKILPGIKWCSWGRAILLLSTYPGYRCEFPGYRRFLGHDHFMRLGVGCRTSRRCSTGFSPTISNQQRSCCAGGRAQRSAEETPDSFQRFP